MAKQFKRGSDLQAAEHFFRSGQGELAEVLLRRVLAGEPKIAKAHELLAYIAGNRGDLKACEEHLLVSSGLPDASGEAFFYLGKIKLAQGLARDAVGHFQRSMAVNGHFFEAAHELGVAYSRLGEHDSALASFGEAENYRPTSWEVHYNTGRTLEEVNRSRDAVDRYDRSIRCDPNQGHVWSNRGTALTELRQFAEALTSYDRALSLLPNDVDTLMNRGLTFMGMGRSREELECYESVLALGAKPDYLLGHWLHTKMLLCRWDGLQHAFDELIDGAHRAMKVSPPFSMIATPASQSVLLACFRAYAIDKFPYRASAEIEWKRRPAERICIGYFSSDFYIHATAHLMAGLFERHDRSQFELIAFSFGHPHKDAMRDRVEAAFDRFIDVSELSDQGVAALSREAGVDVAVDLKGFTAHSRPGIFAYRAAPIQVNYLGFPATMGCEYIDYVIADETLIRPDEHTHYSEKVVCLPDCYQVNDDTKFIAPTTASREEHGLPSHGFVFCCFNSSYKITPDVFDIWMRLLERVPGSALWLFRTNDDAAKALQAEAVARGIDPARLVWAHRMGLAEHLARHRHADLFLDTFYYNAHTTGSDALWAGLPVLTLEGQTFASRVSASLLKAVGIPELIARTARTYEDMAFSLATSPEKLKAIRERLAGNRTEFPLFDTALFARRLETAFRVMLARHRDGLAPDHLMIDA